MDLNKQSNSNSNSNACCLIKNHKKKFSNNNVNSKLRSEGEGEGEESSEDEIEKFGHIMEKVIQKTFSKKKIKKNDEDDKIIMWKPDVNFNILNTSEKLKNIASAKNTTFQTNFKQKLKNEINKNEIKKISKEEKLLGMPSSKINEDVKKDLKLLTMRHLFNPKRHYKENELNVNTNWIHVGTVMDGSMEGIKGSLPLHRRRKTLVKEWMADPDMGLPLKRKYENIKIEEKRINDLRKSHYPKRKKKPNISSL